MEILNSIRIWVLLEIIFAQKTECVQQYCEKPPIGDLSWGTRIKETYLQFINLNLVKCAEQCMRRRRCKSFNYSKQLTLCELNYEKDGTSYSPEESDVFIHSDISGWSEDLIGACKGQICALNEKCQSRNRQCEISDCGPAPDPPDNAVVLHTGHHEVDNGFYYSCKDGYLLKDIDKTKIKGNVIPVKCMQNGQWKTPSFECIELQATTTSLISTTEPRVCETVMVDKSTWVENLSHLYYFSNEKKSWEDAKYWCCERQARIVKIDNMQENSWIKNQLRGRNGDFWTGGKRKSYEDEWFWEDNNVNVEPISYRNWKPTEPNGIKINSHCIRIKESGYWFDIQCSREYNFICEDEIQTENF